MRLWQQVKNTYHWAACHFWRLYYGQPERKLSLYGITGTNGKTTTCTIFANILRAELGREKVGLLSTIAFWYGGREEVNDKKMTTLQSKFLWQYLRKMIDQGITHVVVETTSHALDQHRLAGVRFEGAAILNLAREHLDYHNTMTEYAAAKAKIARLLQPRAPLIINEDNKWLKELLPRLRQLPLTLITFRVNEAASVTTPLPGGANKQNAHVASLLARACGVSSASIAKGVAATTEVAGRMQWIKGRNRRVLIDYAVTPDALELLYADLRKQVSGKIIAILGVMGERDRGKRPDMARVVATYADRIIFTREDPQHEPEEQIFGDLEKGMEGSLVPHQRIVDRRRAIAKALSEAGPKDVVVVTGKGAEVGMKVGDELISWHDPTVIREELAKLT